MNRAEIVAIVLEVCGAVAACVAAFLTHRVVGWSVLAVALIVYGIAIDARFGRKDA